MSEQAEKYQRKHDFAPYTKADGNAVAEEFDAVQAHLDKVPALRNDGKGFSVSPVIPEPTEDNHPATYGQLKNAENSVQKSKEVVTQKAQEVAQNASQTALDRETAEQAKELAQTAAQTATTQADIATQKADIATQKADSITESATLAEKSKQSAVSSENNARKWAVNPEDEPVQNGEFSAYHHAVKARKNKESAEQSASSANSAKETALASAQTATQKASEVETALSQINQAKTTVEQKTNEALSYATQAQSSAQTATEKANLIIGEADRAEEYSTNAQSSAQSAQSYANSANESANRAEQAAVSAERTPVENNLTSDSTTNALSAAMGKKLQEDKLGKRDKLSWDNIIGKPTGLEGYGKTFRGAFIIDHVQPIILFNRAGSQLFYIGTPNGQSSDILIHSYVHRTNLSFKNNGVYFNKEIYANSVNKVIHDGDFQIKEVSRTTNANDLKVDGNYAFTSGGVNLPSSGPWHLQVISGGDQKWCRQIAKKAYSGETHERWITSYNSNNWSSWSYVNINFLEMMVGVPIPWMQTTLPNISGLTFLALNGQRFDKGRYPILAQRYPSGVLTDMRAEFIRGWDGGRNIDRGRQILSEQGDAIRNIAGNLARTAVDNQNQTNGAFKQLSSSSNVLNATHAGSISAYVTDFNASRVVPTANENRPRNVAFQYICIAA